MTLDLKTAWRDTLGMVKISVSPAIFSTWFSQTHITKVDDLGERVLVEIGCPTSFVKNTIESRYFGLVQDSTSKTLGKSVDLTFIVRQNPDIVRPDKDSPAPLFEEKGNTQELTESLRTARIKPSFTFENFAVSGSNQMAHAAALAVSESI
ncbi:MAG: Chromosomal replication initiator protein DnaA [Candidatus Daviesbacteria bacterium GW2011_GWB1_41_15]|nr:MAG: Chromosomal replication initiator protein DnaA [Candidatus Daviesbacteria bacterium GW2011_GWB1_41_15]